MSFRGSAFENLVASGGVTDWGNPALTACRGVRLLEEAHSPPCGCRPRFGYRALDRTTAGYVSEPMINAQSSRAAGVAGAAGAALILVVAGFQSDLVAFAASAFFAPLLGWGVHGLLAIHSEGRTSIMTAGFWIAEVAVLLVTMGYVVAAYGEARGDDSLVDYASLAAIAPGFLILLPVGLGLLGFAAWRMGTLGPWKRLLPSLTATGGVLAPQLMLFGFIALGYATWAHGHKPAADGD